jgi:2'-5' RNA ligase
VRAFIGTLLSSANQDVSDGFEARVTGESRGILRAIPARSAHVTHVFLGDVDAAVAREVAEDLRGVMALLGAVPFTLGRPEVLRAGRDPRLVHARVDRGGREVSQVTQRIVERVRRHPSLVTVSPARSPHVTLARFRRGSGTRDADRVEELLATIDTGPQFQDDRLDGVELIQSELTPKGPIYKVVARAAAARAT